MAVLEKRSKSLAKAACVGVVVEDGSVRAEIRLSDEMSEQILKIADPESEEALREAVDAILLEKKRRSSRITVQVPDWLVEEFAKLCEDQGSNVSRRLLERVRRYVDEDGDVLVTKFTRRTLPPGYEKKSTKQVQVFVSEKEAKGFDEFCREKGDLLVRVPFAPPLQGFRVPEKIALPTDQFRGAGPAAIAQSRAWVEHPELVVRLWRLRKRSCG